jgi:hypothetical protein
MIVGAALTNNQPANARRYSKLAKAERPEDLFKLRVGGKIELGDSRTSEERKTGRHSKPITAKLDSTKPQHLTIT